MSERDGVCYPTCDAEGGARIAFRLKAIKRHSTSRLHRDVVKQLERSRSMLGKMHAVTRPGESAGFLTRGHVMMAPCRFQYDMPRTWFHTPVKTARLVVHAWSLK